jgi:hypothetical protein
MVLVTGVVGVVLFSAVQRPKGVKREPAGSTEFRPPPTKGSASESGAGLPQDLVALSEEGVWTRVDPLTGRLRFRMTWKRLDPREAGEFVIDEPRMWMAEDGRTVRLEAPTARVVWPSRDKEPESGRLSGGVRVSVADREGMDDVSLKGARELGTMRTEALEFQQASREISTAERVEIESPGVKASGVGLTLRLGEGAAALSLLRIERAGRVEFRAEESRAWSEANAGEDGVGEARGVEAEAMAYYRATIGGGVRLESGSRRVTAEDVQVVARTVGGRLREGAIAEFESTGARAATDGAAARSPRGGESSPTVVTWSGALEVRAVRDPGEALAKDDVVVRVSGGAVEVVFEDAAAGNRVAASSVEYGATRRRVAARGVRAEIVDVARVRAETVEVDLTTGDGVARGAGEGWLVGRAAGFDAGPTETGARRRGATWGERATFTLDTSEGPVGAGGVAAVKEVRFFGGAGLVDGEAGLTAEDLVATFERREAGSVPRRLSASGMARAHDARGGCVRGETIDFLFDVDEDGASTPRTATIRGGALAEREGESLGADLIEATLARSADGDVEVATVEAKGGVAATIARGASVGTIVAKADTLRTETGLRAVDLIGEPVTVERRGANGVGALRGGSMRVEGSGDAQRLTVFGAGEALYRMTEREPTGGVSRPTDVEVTWTGGLVYDDVMGRAEVEGGALARMSAGDDERHVGRGERIVVDLAAKEAGAEGDRAVERALIEGNAEHAAEVELRRYAAGPAAGERALEGLAFLRGPSIELTGGASRLRVEGAGVLLLEDRRPAEAEPAAEEFGGMRGTTLLSWEGVMSMDRAAGSGEMTGNVLIRHKDAASGQRAEMASQRARVWFSEGAAGAGSIEMVLTRAEASGGVAARYRALQLGASRLVYDAAGSRVLAASGEGSVVTIYDEEAGRSVSGEAASVDLATGAYRIERMDAVSMPR